jgi:flavin reductase (DIM6/NTAB) family NADH-FMN oxidoreductase RutF
MVVVRPTRYTFEFMNRFPDFTLTAFSKEYRKDLSLLGKKSGRDQDKIAETRLHPIASEKVNSPAFAEAELILECRKTYWDDLNPEHFMDPDILKNYEKHDEHRIYFGETLSIRGTGKYLK